VDQVLDAAEELFYARGVQAVGMDEIRTAAGVSLKRLYQCYPSKQALVTAYLDRRDDRWMAALEAHVAGAAEPIPAVFDWLEIWFASPGFRGCGFLNAFGELGEPVAPTVRRHKDRLYGYLRDLAQGYPDPDLLADQLLILVDGATVTAMLGRPGMAAAAKKTASALLG